MRYRRIISSLAFFAAIFIIGCSGSLFVDDNSINKSRGNVFIPAKDNFNEISKDDLIHDKPLSPGVENTLKRAQQLARIRWVTRGKVPRVGSNGFYSANREYIGIPYSLVMHVNTYVGLDVSLYTFLTAVNNPKSVLYTENVKKPPYNGVQCAPYYGTVCSTAVWYALGVSIPYFTRFVPTLDFLSKPKNSSPESIALCDILLSGGHMVMVYDIGRNMSGGIEKVTLFECATDSVEDTKLVIYSFDEFKKRWDSVGWKIYRYKELDKNLSYEDLNYIAIDDHTAAPLVFNEDLCTVRGDKVAFREGETVGINIFNTSFSNIEIYKNDQLYSKRPLFDNYIEFYKLPYGDYKVRLSNKNQVSDFVYFEVLNVEVEVSNTGKITTKFHSKNAMPEYMDICISSQSPQAYFPFSEADISSHSITVDPVDREGPLYCKVYFRGKYGRVSNVPILIQ